MGTETAATNTQQLSSFNDSLVPALGGG